MSDMGKNFTLLIVFLAFLSPNTGLAQTKIPPAAESGLALKMLKKSQPGRWDPPPQPIPEDLIVREDEVPARSPSPSEINKTIELEVPSPDKNSIETSPDPKTFPH
jgi:hypothetical protein